PRLGAKTFEQAAGFLRINDGKNALDASTVHPEAYPLVKKILTDTGRDIRSLIGDTATLRALDPKRYTDEIFGVPTVQDILRELEKPGRDPRPEFRTAEFKDGVERLSDLKPGMRLEGVVTNVTGFGAFVDIGVHQYGLLHISELADKFVKDAHDVVAAGDVVTVRVMEVDEKRKRIGLSMKSPSSASGADDRKVTREHNGRSDRTARPEKGRRSGKGAGLQQTGPQNTAMADALRGLIGD
ncbi:MAG: S1 RNA-binding domain-containing protein, partial [Gammaproteobacteria bacterium]|nr:S1 RNA-binding domain-containing protein [Gammaproteobacteria bacterium]